MSTQTKLILIFLFAIVPVLFLLEILSFYERLDQTEARYYRENKANFNTLLDLQKQSIRTVAMELATDNVIKKAYRENKPQMIIDDKLAFWNGAKSDKLIYEIHFFKPPAVSFVNFSNFTSIGKDVSDVRSDIAWVTSSFKSSSHLMMCKTYAGIRATYPIIDNDGTMLGGLSLGKKVDWLPETFKQISGKSSLIVYTESSAHKLAPKYYDNFIKDRVVSHGLILGEHTLDVSPSILGELDFNAPVQKLYHNGRLYSVNIFTLDEFDQKTMGYFVIANDMEAFYSDFYEHIAETFLILVMASIFFYVLIRHNFTSFRKRIEDIRLLTNSYRKKEFASLEQYDLQELKENQAKDEITALKQDIVLMGASLHDHYNELEDEVNQKTRQLYTLNAQLLKQLYTDDLTQIPNRNAFFRDLEQMSAPSLAIININNFKNINDIYGIDIGNQLLRDSIKLTETLAQHEGLSYYRLGSDETAFLHDKADPKAFTDAVMKIVSTIEEHTFECPKVETSVNIDYTVGISFEKENIVEKADMALVSARKAHRKHRTYNDKFQLRKLHLDNIELTNKIRHAVNNDKIVPYYQPIVDANGSILKYESLVRMIDANVVLKPFQFLDLAMKTRYYQKITSIMFEKTFKQFENESCGFSINLQAADIMDRNTVAHIYTLLKNYSDPSKVIFEIIESESIENLDDVEEFISHIKTLGAKIAIDDFGSGYSNFSYLLKLRPDYLKIDGSLIKSIDTDKDAYAITRTIVSFAKTLGITTIAEYIHSKEIFDIAVDLGIDEFQGFYFSEPVATLYTKGTLRES